MCTCVNHGGNFWGMEWWVDCGFEGLSGVQKKGKKRRQDEERRWGLSQVDEFGGKRRREVATVGDMSS